MTTTTKRKDWVQLFFAIAFAIAFLLAMNVAKASAEAAEAEMPAIYIETAGNLAEYSILDYKAKVVSPEFYQLHKSLLKNRQLLSSKTIVQAIDGEYIFSHKLLYWTNKTVAKVPSERIVYVTESSDDLERYGYNVHAELGYDEVRTFDFVASNGRELHIGIFQKK